VAPSSKYAANEKARMIVLRRDRVRAVFAFAMTLSTRICVSRCKARSRSYLAAVHSAKLAWPPPQPSFAVEVATSMIFSHPGADWWQQREERGQAMREEYARVIDSSEHPFMDLTTCSRVCSPQGDKQGSNVHA
jgi:hypothetical protein